MALLGGARHRLHSGGGLSSSTASGAWQELAGIDEITIAEVSGPVTLVLVVAILGVHAPAVIKGSGYDWRPALLTTAVNLAAIPAAGAAYGTRVIALTPVQGESRSEQVSELLALRGLNERILATLGRLIFLLTVHYAARLPLHSSGRPPEYALVFGGFGSLLVALLYVPSWTAIRARGDELQDALFPLTQESDPPELLRTLKHREKLAEHLGINRTLAADLQSGLLIAAPLLAGASALILAK